MPKTLDEIRTSPHVGPRTETWRVCLSGELRDELKRRDAVLLELRAQIAMKRDAYDADDRAGRPPRRHGQRSDLAQLEAQAETAAAACDEIYEQARDHEVEVVFAAKQNGVWRNWCTEHPARDGDNRDQDEFRGLLNADDLIANLGSYVTSISGQPARPGDWDFVAANSSPGDLKEAAVLVVTLHERSSGELGKSRTTWLADQRPLIDFE